MEQPTANFDTGQFPGRDPQQTRRLGAIAVTTDGRQVPAPPPSPSRAIVPYTSDRASTPAARGDENAPAWGLPALALIVAIVIGAVVALLVIPSWVPVLGNSIVESDARVFWYLSRSSALVGFVLLWVSMASGLLISSRLSRSWPKAMTAFDLHQYTSLLGLGFGLFHALILLANHYVQYSLAQVLIPFVDAPYRPVWTGLGQISLYVLALVTFTFYIRRQIGKRAWYLIHLLSYVTFIMVIVHGLLSGTDSGNVLVLWLYWLSLVSLAGLTVYRVGIDRQQSEARQA